MLKHKTFVKSRTGTVLVSTVPAKHDVGGRMYYETMVFPVNAQGNPDTSTELGRAENIKPKLARRAHRTLCQQFDVENRPYKFDDRAQRYVPVGDLPILSPGPRWVLALS